MANQTAEKSDGDIGQRFEKTAQDLNEALQVEVETNNAGNDPPKKPPPPGDSSGSNPPRFEWRGRGRARGQKPYFRRRPRHEEYIARRQENREKAVLFGVLFRTVFGRAPRGKR